MRDATGSSKGKKKFFGKEKCSSSAGTMENRADLDLQGPSANMRTLLGMGFRYVRIELTTISCGLDQRASFDIHQYRDSVVSLQ